MRYKRIGTNGEYRLNVPQLIGGLNTHTDPSLVEDNELTELCNLRWKQGALTTRPAVRAVGVAPFCRLPGNADYDMGKTFESICAHPFEVDGELCTVVISAVNFVSAGGNPVSASRLLQVVTLDGTVKKEYTVGGEWPDIQEIVPMVAVPCDKEAYGCDFLVYHGKNVYKPNDEQSALTAVDSVELYAPLLTINGRSYVTAASSMDTFQGEANGVMYEGFNMLTRRYRARYTGGHENGDMEVFCLPTAIAASTAVTVEGATAYGHFKVEVPADGTSNAFYLRNASTVLTYYVSADAQEGRVIVEPSLPVSTVSDNIEITCTAADNTENSLAGATLAAWFGGTNNRLGGTRLFLAGFADRPSKVMWSDVNNPLYFPENNYMYVGDLSQKITALEKQEDMLVIFKERELYYTTYVQGSIDEEAVIKGTNVDVTVSQAYFPLTQLSPYIGCDCPHTLAMCRNRLVWLCSDGRVYTLVTAAQYSERNVREIGGKIVQRLIVTSTAEERRLASAADVDGCYYLLIGNTMYLFDYADAGFVNISSYASGEKAAKNIAWYMYEYSGLPSYAWHRLVSDGAHKAMIISTCHFWSTGGVKRYEHTFVRVAYTLCEASADAYMTLTSNENSVNSTVADQTISSYMVTKHYDFGDIAVFKRIKALFLAAKGQALVSFIADGQEEYPSRFSALTMDVHLVMPRVKRCKTLAVRVQSDTPISIRGLRVQYQPFGTVR